MGASNDQYTPSNEDLIKIGFQPEHVPACVYEDDEVGPIIYPSRTIFKLPFINSYFLYGWMEPSCWYYVTKTPTEAHPEACNMVLLNIKSENELLILLRVFDVKKFIA